MKTSSRYFDMLYRDAYRRKTLTTCTIALTEECNFRCLHCYANEHRPQLISFENTQSFIDQAADMGNIFYTLTGGEPLMHPHFCDIYLHMKKKGGVITLFSNGSLIDKQVAMFLKTFMPKAVEITLYGSSDSTYRRVTGQSGMFHKVISGVECLIGSRIPVTLKMLVIKENFSDYDDVVRIAQHYHVPFMYDCGVFPDFYGRKDHLKSQLSTDEMISLELKGGRECFERWKSLEQGDPEIDREWHRLAVRDSRVNNKVFDCAAGKVSCFLTSEYRLRMCYMIDLFQFDLHDTSVSDAWAAFNRISEQRVSGRSVCSDCDARELCGVCAAWHYKMNDSLDMTRGVDLHCKAAKRRKSLLDEWSSRQLG